MSGLDQEYVVRWYWEKACENGGRGTKTSRDWKDAFSLRQSAIGNPRSMLVVRGALGRRVVTANSRNEGISCLSPST